MSRVASSDFETDFLVVSLTRCLVEVEVRSCFDSLVVVRHVVRLHLRVLTKSLKIT